MDAELSALEEKLAQLVQRLDALREENRELRQQIAARADESVRLGEKLGAAKTRIEALRALKRHLARTVWRTMIANANAPAPTLVLT